MKQHIGPVVSTVTLQQKGPGFSSQVGRAFLQVLMVARVSLTIKTINPNQTDEDLDLVMKT